MTWVRNVRLYAIGQGLLNLPDFVAIDIVVVEI